MKIYNFTQPGGFPLTQEILNNLQNNSVEIGNVITSLFGNNNLILSGVEESNKYLSAGWVVIDGEVLRFDGGADTGFITIQELQSQLTYADGASKTVVTERVAISGTTGVSITAFTRVSNYKNIQDQVAKINPCVTTISGTRPGDFQLTIGKSVNGIAHIDGWFTLNAEDIASRNQLAIISPNFGFTRQQFTVMAQLQHRQTSLISNFRVNVTAVMDELVFSTVGLWPSDLEFYDLYIPIHISVEL